MATKVKRAREPIEDWVIHRRRPALLFSTPTVGINEEHLFEVEEVTRGKECAELDLILLSPGGDPHVAFRTIALLRKRFQQIHAVIPGPAMSAATLIAISCDTLSFALSGHLGPLDMQQNRWNEKGRRERAAVNLTPDAIDKVMAVAIDICCNFILQFTAGGDSAEAFRRAAVVGHRTASPMLAGATVQALGKSNRSLSLGEYYAFRALRQRANPPTGSQAGKLALKLVHGYSTHGFAIDDEQCRSIGLPVQSLRADEDRLLRSLAVSLMASSGSAQSDIRLIDVPLRHGVDSRPTRAEGDASLFGDTDGKLAAQPKKRSSRTAAAKRRPKKVPK